MAICTEVEDYCQDCPAFEPEVKRSDVYYADGQEATVGNTIVLCKHRKMCARFMAYLKNQLAKKKGERL